ncbi:bifunctional UDP-2,4-diacetamido-2,4,6-trideoxy-beta-L-altropyranose hydrolase/GNAT family N-acetyltransferase [Microbacterium sp. WCS2018Hpa-9]|uniref:bifunctional UDP-2,4-diacetamido-2,4,6-trideoxy-beta-L-altropyranose hydrolase/GNAT family N-acetyltransferase n=1 Tax=Microbacterium sp. WCS2018Hpa-9 TaxID=3073635 RepID=UPI00288A5013|nr:bifunctional UDP-2,4-diacetamido-2,4,6-trideoxy-beta-L-altropyranose hydrolase/GNAT family N-acetyltransferase [Microbacterium sp. WCS2018Hpa-9]
MSGRRVLLHCNAGVESGMGHLMRTLTVARAARDRGWSASVFGDVDGVGADILRRMDPELELFTTDGAGASIGDFADRARGVDVIHLDSYQEVPDLSSLGPLISNMQDGPFGVRDADLAIDANLASQRTFASPERSLNHLAGIDAAVVRTQVRAQRDVRTTPSAVPRVLVVMGGTDPHGVTARVVAAFDRVPSRLEITVIDPRRRAEVTSAAESSRHSVEVLGFVDDLPAIARGHDLAVTAAGTSVWDFACMGLPMALVCVADNQRAGYHQVIERGLAIGLGEPPHESLDERIGLLADLLDSPESLAETAAELKRIVDGLGSWRIVASWEQLLNTRPHVAPRSAVIARPATIDDGQMLFEWRNDATVRLNSRSRGEIDWESHRDWLARSLDDPDRRLLMIESDGMPVATCRWDRRSEDEWEISITVAPESRGRGIAASAVNAAESTLTAGPPVRLVAAVHRDNVASRRLFERAGYLPHLPADEDGFLAMAKWRLS